MVLEKSVVQYADEAEKTHGATSHAFIVKSNAMRRTTEETKLELRKLEAEIEQKTKELG